MATLFRDNPNTLEVKLENLDGTVKTGATVTATLKDEDGVDVPGAVDLPMPEGDPGTYSVEISSTISTPDRQYFLEITGDDGGTPLVFETLNVKAVNRKSA